ncbi:MAG: hypothetical protein U1E70_18065 [Acetobacteraceae bacterium]
MKAKGPPVKLNVRKGKGEILAARIDQTAEDQLCATRITRLNGLVVGQRPGDRQAAVRSAVARVNVQYILVEEISADFNVVLLRSVKTPLASFVKLWASGA